MHSTFLILFSVAFRVFLLINPNTYPQFTSSHTTAFLSIPTASFQYSHLNIVPIPYFLLSSHPSFKSSSLVTAFLLLLSGDIQSNPGPVTICTLNIRSLFHENRSTYIDEVIQANSPDVFALTETHHNLASTSPAQLSQATPPGFQLFSFPRLLPDPTNTEIHAGGVAFLCKDTLAPALPHLPLFKSFEAASVCLTSLSHKFTIFNVYRPPDSSTYSKPFSVFLDEFTSFLTLAATLPHNFLITGDFNIHCNDTSNPHTIQFLSVLSDFNLTQHITFPTHTNLNTLDLVITPNDSVPAITCLPSSPSDHFAILSTFNIQSPPPHPPIFRSFRRINSIDPSDFMSDLSSSSLILSPPSQLEDLVACYNSTLTSIINKHAPVITKVVRSSHSNPWFTPAIRALKRTRRRLEHQWKSLPSLGNLTALRRASNCYHNAILSAKKLYHSNLIKSNCSNPRLLWKTVNTLLHRSATPSSPNISTSTTASVAHQFATFFSDKVTNLRATIHPTNQSPHIPKPTRNPPILSHFRPVDISEITKIVMHSPSKQCELDPIPTSLLKLCISVLAPTITTIVNLSLSTGTFPSSFKQSIVSPLLKNQPWTKTIFLTTGQYLTFPSCPNLQNGLLKTAYPNIWANTLFSTLFSLHTLSFALLNPFFFLSTTSSSVPSANNKSPASVS